MGSGLGEPYICHECVRDAFLAGEIEQSNSAECSYCENHLPSWPLQMLADRVEFAFEEHYTRTNPNPNDWQEAMLRDRESDYEWERDGDPVQYVIAEAVGICEQAASDVLEILGNKYYDHEMAQLGEETEFDSDAHYELAGSSTWGWESKWERFEKSLQSESRYFGRHAAAHLRSVFDGIDKLSTWGRSPLVVDAGPGAEIEALFRARVFQSREALKPALCRPDKELGSPPGRFAASGRMNARGISVFYGATSQEVALAEVRPPVGSDVAVAAFKIIRTLRLLDLSALEKAHITGSVFDPTLSQRMSHVAFLRTLGKKMTRPVMPADQEFDYLATQAIADFLATENNPVLDGIVFESTQADGGRNVVLFHKASLVREMDLPDGAKLSATTEGVDEEGPCTDFHVHTFISPDNDSNDEVTSEAGIRWFLDMDEDHSDPAAIVPTLEIIPESLEIHHVERVEVKCTRFQVSRSTSGPRENRRF